MDKMSGWIILHRKIQNNYLWKSSSRFDERSAWVDLLLMASHEGRTVRINGEVLEVEPGQRITSLGKLSERWRWNRKTVKKYLLELQEQDMIHVVFTKRWTSIFIVNYSKYQLRGSTDWTSERTTDWTSERTSERTQTNNYINNYINNEKINRAPPTNSRGEVLE